MQNGQHNFSRQDKLVWGKPAGSSIADYLAATGLQRAFIVTNKSLSGSNYLVNLQEAMGDKYVGTYAGCAAHSPRSSVLEGAAAARLAKADVIIALGGGSVIDAAKLMLPCLWLGIDSDAGIDALKAGNFSQQLKVEQSLRMIAVPTTLSAAEFTHLAGITDVRHGTKELFEHPLYAPSMVALDPLATVDTPTWLMASTGIRSIDHCVETICSTLPSPYADAMAIGGLKLLSRGLRSLTGRPDDIANRLDCQLGTWLAISGPVAGVPIGASHVIGRVLGGAFGVPHGHTSCVLLAGVLRWNSVVNTARQDEIANALGAAPGVSAADEITNLVQSLGQPTTLREIGIKREQFPLIAEKALQMFLHPGSSGNARRVSSSADVFEILESVF